MSSGKEKNTQVVLSHHVQALVARDLDGLMEDYTEDSVLLINLVPGPLRGPTAIRGFFAQALSPEFVSNLIIAQQVVDGEVAYLVWSSGTAMPFGTDTFVVRNGKITAQTAAIHLRVP